jgi:hypothetical protein
MNIRNAPIQPKWFPIVLIFIFLWVIIPVSASGNVTPDAEADPYGGYPFNQFE